MNTYLNIQRLQISHYVNGPGVRLVIWVQGCTLNCPGCFNQDLLPHEKQLLFEVDQLAIIIEDLVDRYHLEGITLSGGEPLQQANAIRGLLARLSDISVVIFTGYTLNEIKRSTNPAILEILDGIDILIAGRYKKRNDSYDRVWFDNPDKVIYYLSERYENENFNRINSELIANEDIDLSGFISPSEVSSLLDLQMME